MITLVIKGSAADACAALITRGIEAEPSPLDWPQRGEALFNAPKSETIKIVEWFCEPKSEERPNGSLLFYTWRDHEK